jgi:hypothetical protein
LPRHVTPKTKLSSEMREKLEIDSLLQGKQRFTGGSNVMCWGKPRKLPPPHSKFCQATNLRKVAAADTKLKLGACGTQQRFPRVFSWQGRLARTEGIECIPSGDAAVSSLLPGVFRPCETSQVAAAG